MFLLEDNKLSLIGERTCRILKQGQEAKELSNKDDFSFLL
jgi:dipeptidase E